jgi:S-adenosylmethionine:tRNA ribosyltransferase-isomerase
LRVEDFDFDLPDERIALRPTNPRDAARLLVVAPDFAPADRVVRDLPGLLSPGDILVVNDTKVMPVRFDGVRHARDADGPGAKIEVTLTQRISANGFRALAKPAKRLRPGDRVTLGATLDAVVSAREGAEIDLAFALSGTALEDRLAAQGAMPLPPYIAGKRAPDSRDAGDYQTVYARVPGSVAAPTAGLHFTPKLLERLHEAGIGRVHVTLHVGPGTFLPVTVEDTEQHVMHAERAELGAETARILNEARAKGGRIVAVGSTALRTLESAADETGALHEFAGETALFITPGYRFKAVDALLTNFHLPRSTLFMLVSAFAGTETMKAAYAYAIAHAYRFYSYGDASLLFRSKVET